MSPDLKTTNQRLYSAYYHGERQLNTLKEWCELTGKKYKTVTKRIQRIRQTSKFRNPQRLALFNKYAFYEAMNKNTELDDFIYPEIRVIQYKLEKITEGKIYLVDLEKINPSVPLSYTLKEILLRTLHSDELADKALRELHKNWFKPEYLNLLEQSWKTATPLSTLRLRLKKSRGQI